MEKPILAAVDDSPHAADVLDAAVKLCRTFGVPLVLCRVAAMPIVQLSPDGLPLSTDLQGDTETRAKRELDAIAKRVPTDVQMKQVTVLDTPWQGIVEAADKEDVALIVIGTHSLNALDRILGTTAAKVVNHAERSVLVVRGTL